MSNLRARRAAGRRYAILVAALSWATIAIDFGLGASRLGLAGALSVYAAYFTLWTAVLCAVVMTAQARVRWTGKPGFLARPSTATGAAAAFIIVAAVYNLMLRSVYEPTGWYVVTNEMVHVVLPLLFVADWLFFVDKRELTWRGMAWMAFPLAYMLVAVVRGELTGFYPYPFANVNELGYPRALLNAVVVAVFYAAVILALNAIGRRRAAPSSR